MTNELFQVEDKKDRTTNCNEGFLMGSWSRKKNALRDIRTIGEIQN